MELSAANAECLARVLCDLDPTKGAAEVRADGYLWIRTRTHGAWHRSVRIRGHESQAAAAQTSPKLPLRQLGIQSIDNITPINTVN